MTGMNCAQNKLQKTRKNKGKTRNPGKDFPVQLLNLLVFYCEELCRKTGLQRSERSLKTQERCKKTNHGLQTGQENKPLPRTV